MSTTVGQDAVDWASIDTPALLVDVTRLERNIDDTARAFAAAGVALRPHIKTSKCLQIAQRQRAAGAMGFTCSTPAEARALTEAGFAGLLYAHLPVGDGKVASAVDLAGRHGVVLLLDSVEVAQAVSSAADRAGLDIDYVLDIDTGHHRTGVDPDLAVDLADELASLPRLRLRGILTHEGHLATHGPNREALDADAQTSGQLMARVAGQLRAAGYDCGIVSVGSTPGMRTAPFVEGVTEGRPGTYVYLDGNQVRLGSGTWEQCALTVLARVVSVNRAGIAIIDAGLKAMSADAMSPQLGGGEIRHLDGSEWPGLRFDSANEEHGFVTGDTADLRVGDLMRIIPHHACGTTNMWSRLHAIHADGTVELWPIVARH